MKPYHRPAIIARALFIASCSDLHVTHQEAEPSLHVTHMQLEGNICGLLQQEIQAIQKGMMSLVPAISSGDWAKVAEIGKNIESSYLLKQ